MCSSTGSTDTGDAPPEARSNMASREGHPIRSGFGWTAWMCRPKAATNSSNSCFRCTNPLPASLARNGLYSDRCCVLLLINIWRIAGKATGIRESDNKIIFDEVR
jgi:hypothetical protein